MWVLVQFQKFSFLPRGQLEEGNVKPRRSSMIYVWSSPRIWHNFILVSLLLLILVVQNNKLSQKKISRFWRPYISQKCNKSGKVSSLVRRMGCLLFIQVVLKTYRSNALLVGNFFTYFQKKLQYEKSLCETVPSCTLYIT